MGKRKSLASALKRVKETDKRLKVLVSQNEQNTKPKTSSQPRSPHGLIPFEKDDRILFIGEGNFSFSASCVENHLEHGENILATSFDDREGLLQKYPEAADHISSIEDCCGTVKYSVDATKLQRDFPTRKFDVIIFMFPHVAAGIADEDRNILTNQKMLSGFFKSAQDVLNPDGKIAVTLAVGKTYELWDLRGLAKAQGLKVVTSSPFVGTRFPGYEHRRTQGTKDGATEFRGGRGEDRSARWTIFSKSTSTPTGPAPSKTNQDDSDDDDA